MESPYFLESKTKTFDNAIAPACRKAVVCRLSHGQLFARLRWPRRARHFRAVHFRFVQPRVSSNARYPKQTLVLIANYELV